MNQILQDRIKKIKEEADVVSERVRMAERMLKEVPGSKTTDFAYLRWDARKERIVYSPFYERPLIEAPLEERISNVHALSGLIDRVIRTSEEIMGIKE